ncbi:MULTISPECIES: flagellar biosynthesis protein FlhA [unclassified Aureimonas]|uniref:flagellar biosynthesis protein FlhA n=1 Tax=unclassified Aureimonas TaxID=2615206 RepID=UPI000701446D|nr:MULTISPECIES: flagellar biosynthesis protein FlhA [unclassified Aureimonas]KQT60026.1 hypothetical protein ASG62_24205 [Aureimonas sp. Leaf427]KQT79594.1 hypothetical protein ASG54_08500 [Aureimonas sp. Leaf460]
MNASLLKAGALLARPDLAFAGLFLLMVAVLMIPVPTVMLDVLVAMNLAFSIMIMTTTIYLRNVLELSTFPSIILISTVFRLSLTVAATRKILAEGDAGHIIRGFGQFVVAGNVLVGIIVFLILALVQFLVVTKGAERIAEVSARFTLDALPGKQLSIDNDLRNGVLNGAAASQRRFLLEKESQFFGAMDGAMRFVKGDAIATLGIAFVNLVGGLAVGMVQHGLAFGQALHVYSLLTVGEGLVSQIPAMLTSVSAGVVVTRVVADDSQSLGIDIGRQVLRQPRTLFISAAAVAAMAAVPGFPSVVLLLLAAGIGGLGYSIVRAARPRPSAPDEQAGGEEPEQSGEEKAPPSYAPTPLGRQEWGDPIVLRGSAATLSALEMAGVGNHLDAAVHSEARRAGIALVIPKFAEHSVAPFGSLEIVVEGVGQGHLSDVSDLDPADLAHRIALVARRQSAAIFSIADLDQWLSDLERRHGRLIEDLRERRPAMRLLEAVRTLVVEGIPLAHPRLFIETLLSGALETMSVDEMAAIGRRKLMAQALDQRRAANGLLPLVALGTEWERRFLSAPRDDGHADLLGALNRVLSSMSNRGDAPVVLLRTLRRADIAPLAAAAGLDAFFVEVEDVPPHLDIQHLATVEIDESMRSDDPQLSERP